MALMPDSVDKAESEKYEREFDDYQTKSKAQKEEWKKQNPEAAKKLEEEDYDWAFEDENVRELKQIFQGQSAMNEVLRDLHRKMDSIIERQERSLNLLSGVKSGGGAGQPQVQGGGGGGVPVDTIRRDEVNAVLANQRELVSAARDIKNFVSDVHGKVTNIQQTQARGQGSVQPVGGSAGGGDMAYISSVVNEIRDGVNRVKMDMQNGYARQSGGNQNQGQPVCPQVNCVNTMVLVGALAVQLVLIMAYLMFKDSKEQQAKKFY